MKRREFSKMLSLGAVALSTTGFVRFNGTAYEGDCVTTTDILGPFYRPDSPVRDNLVIPGAKGDIVQLMGVVRHKDCQTPYKNAKVELWHCSAEEIYDNDSDQFLYRGTVYCDDHGNYKFTTQMPVPYDAGGGNYRPAHFHMMVSAPGYQSFVTQIYFTGDPYLQKDFASAAPEAKMRTLDVREKAGTRQILFDINMNDKLLASAAALDKIVGIYLPENSGRKLQFFQREGVLWMKNEVFGEHYEYVGDNTFRYPGTSSGYRQSLHFELQDNGKVKLTQSGRGSRGEMIRIYLKS